MGINFNDSNEMRWRAREREKQQQKIGSLGPMRGSGVARRVHHNNERQREKKTQLDT